MAGLFGEDVDREQFFEAARRQAERDYNQDNTNAQVRRDAERVCLSHNQMDNWLFWRWMMATAAAVQEP